MSDIIDFSEIGKDESLSKNAETQDAYEWLVYCYRHYGLPLKAIVADALWVHRHHTKLSFNEKLRLYSWNAWLGFCGDYCRLANDNRQFAAVCAAPIRDEPCDTPDVDAYRYPCLKTSPFSYFSRRFYPRFGKYLMLIGGAIFDVSRNPVNR